PTRQRLRWPSSSVLSTIGRQDRSCLLARCSSFAREARPRAGRSSQYMGTMSFLLPPGASPEALRELERSSRAGGPDNMPALTDIRLTSTQMIALRYVDESGYLVAPWDIPGAGLLMGASATLMERSAPYNLLIELARGKVNQVRNQLAEWRAIGLQVSPA